MFDADALLSRLARHRTLILACFDGVSVEQARFRPALDKWSALETLCHLVDEERDDFGARLRSVLEDPGREWTGIDPPAWVIDRKYQERELKASLAEFDDERQRTIEWIGSWPDPNWNATRTHPIFGSMRAGDLLVSWVVHDLLHLAQLARIHSARIAAEGEPFDAGYALP